MRFVGADYAEGLRLLRGEGLLADMVYLDLGMSSLQLDAWERGFSYSYDAPLDMRMDPAQAFSAADLLNEWPESRIANVLRRFGEERHAAAIAREIVRRRPLSSTSELVAAIKAGMPASARFGAGHPAKRTFQAIRIAVNGELDSLERGLPEAWELLRPGGRLAAISFHSLEDRPLKRFLADRARGCICPPELPVCVCGHEPEAELLTRRAVSPGAEEVSQNPRSRSAHLRGRDQARRRARRCRDGRRRSGPQPPHRPPQRRAAAAPRASIAGPRAGGHLIPLAVGRTAVAVRQLPGLGPDQAPDPRAGPGSPCSACC